LLRLRKLTPAKYLNAVKSTKNDHNVNHDGQTIFDRCQGHRRKIILTGVLVTAKKFFSGVFDTGQKFLSGVKDTAENFSAVSLTPVEIFQRSP
jgi:hypothetical protein